MGVLQTAVNVVEIIFYAAVIFYIVRRWKK